MKLNKTVITYFLLAVAAFLLDKLYALFGHGVTSPWMSTMYLILLGFGMLAFLLVRIMVPDIVFRKGYRLFYNLYNSGIAVLVNGMLLKGILEIAGGTSRIIPWFLWIGCGLIAAGMVLFCRLMGAKPQARHT